MYSFIYKRMEKLNHQQQIFVLEISISMLIIILLWLMNSITIYSFVQAVYAPYFLTNAILDLISGKLESGIIMGVMGMVSFALLGSYILG